MTTFRTRSLVLLLLFGAALFLRVRGLGEVGLSEDEANKILAVESYRRGDFSPNAEHPMFMKLLCTGSVILAERANHMFQTAITPEAALRFPVAVAGAAVTPAVYLLGIELLNPPAAMMAAALWAFDINAVALTRIAKEDALVALFFVLGSAFLLRGKRLHFQEPAGAMRNYIACGASFGLLFASKYLIPIGWLPLIYYDLFRFRNEPRWRISRSASIKIYGAFVLILFLCNPILLSPGTWSHAWEHLIHKRLTHTGYLMMGDIEFNKAFYTFWGTPAYYYPLYLAVKTPLPLLILLVTGLAYTLRRYRDDRFLFLGLYFVLWLFLLTLPGGKFTRYAVTLLPAVVLLQALGMYMLYAGARSHFEKRGWPQGASVALLAVLVLGTAGWYVVLDFRNHPFYSLYVSEQGGGSSRRGFYFPQDDFYDAGLREAVREVCRSAPGGTEVFGATPAAFQYYQHVFGRADLQFHSTADPELLLEPGRKPFILYQDYRAYFENYYLLTFFHGMLRPQHTVLVQGIPSVTVYRLCRDASCARSPFWNGKHWPDRLASLSGS